MTAAGAASAEVMAPTDFDDKHPLLTARHVDDLTAATRNMTAAIRDQTRANQAMTLVMRDLSLVVRDLIKALGGTTRPTQEIEPMGAGAAVVLEDPSKIG